MEGTSNNSLPIVNIKVVGVGGGGCNAVNRMIDAKLKGVQFISINTDKQMLLINKAQTRLQVGEKLTKGQGAGNDPQVGERAAEESRAIIAEVLKGADLVFITAGMGGGTGTGAAPVIASVAKELGIITVAVVTKPFLFEAKKRMDQAERGIAELRKYVDTIVIIPNQKLLTVLPKGTSMMEAYLYADDALRQGIAGISDIITHPTVMNLDFADIKKVIKNKGKAHMGIGRASGENKVIEAVKQAVSSPLLETSIEGATGLIIQVKGGLSVSLNDIATAAQLVNSVVSEDCEVIFGNGIEDGLGDDIEITLIATGLKETDEEIKRNLEYQKLSSLKAAGEGATLVNVKEMNTKEKVFENFEKEFAVNKQSPIQTVVETPKVEQVVMEEVASTVYVAPAMKTEMRVEKEVSRDLKSNRITIEDDIPPYLKRIKRENK